MLKSQKENLMNYLIQISEMKSDTSILNMATLPMTPGYKTFETEREAIMYAEDIVSQYPFLLTYELFKCKKVDVSYDFQEKAQAAKLEDSHTQNQLRMLGFAD